MSEEEMDCAGSDFLTPVLIEGELRIRDIDLAKRLGFANPIDIRKLVRRYEADLAQGVLATVAKTSDDRRGGRPAIEYYLNRRPAHLITSSGGHSRAPKLGPPTASGPRWPQRQARRGRSIRRVPSPQVIVQLPESSLRKRSTTGCCLGAWLKQLRGQAARA